MIGRVRIAILGFGLIGGSIARALRSGGGAAIRDGRHSIAAWSRRPDGPRTALDEGVLDAAPADLGSTLEDAELVVLATPPLACLDLLDELAGRLRAALPPGATVSDVASTKRAIVARADELGLRFVGGHPMAGLEARGYAAADEGLFVGRPWVVCPGAVAGPEDVARIERLATDCGARPLQLDPAVHDAATAAISHAPLVVSAALVEALASGPEWPTAASLAAGGWRDMSRLAKGDPEMGAGIVATNADEVTRRLRAVRAVLDAWIDALDVEEPDPATLAARFAGARDRLDG
jgi:prephenate dehydrogenase